MLDAALADVAGDRAAAAVLEQLRATPAVSAGRLRERTGHDAGPALERLRAAGVLTDHPRLPSALVHHGLLAVLDAPLGGGPAPSG
ncbi:hypothetical protein BX266_0107 [Streptomyces sp. TLI_171]|nr:hypothetical protein BX266_0107 [Streptomyces sp. TLI_171]